MIFIACAGIYRHLQARLKNNAESVAFYGGIDKEGRIINSRFKELLRHHGRILSKQWQFGMVQVRSPAARSEAMQFRLML